MATSPLPSLWYLASMEFSRRILMVIALAGMSSLSSGAAQAAQCLLCTTDADNADQQQASSVDRGGERQLRVEVAADLDFARLIAGSRGGSVRIDPLQSGTQAQGDVRTVSGMGFSGRILVEGVPGRTVRIDLPDDLTLTAANGGQIRLTGITTGQSPVLRLGPDGRLDVAFGGQLDITGSVDGDFRGRIPITVSYE